MASATTVAAFFAFFSFVHVALSCQDTFFDTNVTLGGAKDIKTISGCFAPTESLIKVSFIQILDQNVTVLRKGAIYGLPNLVDIIIENSSVTDLDGGCFSNLPKLYLIKLRHNNFSTVREGVFNNLPVTELCLTNNSIESIHPKAFNDIPNLNSLILDQNRIGYWSSEWFQRSPNIAVLNFEYNWITNIPAKALQNVNGLHYNSNVKLNVSTQVYLNNNRIKYLSDGAFNGIEMFGWLFLHKNELEEISEASLGTLKKVDWVRLEHNQLKCIPKRLVDISPKVLWYIGNNPLTDECISWYENIRN
ncbi:leucine-rich repeat-containing protein 15-like [Sitophilus oryzae]|uniref:Leucine-rich repeat-containing protein 15-like n=1 Tax=Sitophilus oryzae TaxID=7048 RepID=A0A6J2Y9Y8_SITOR|nr:leucine-rich repeat-containing protein 15-like [Sitophilus oryzae]